VVVPPKNDVYPEFFEEWDIEIGHESAATDGVDINGARSKGSVVKEDEDPGDLRILRSIS